MMNTKVVWEWDGLAGTSTAVSRSVPTVTLSIISSLYPLGVILVGWGGGGGGGSKLCPRP